eukprot:gene13501-14905_t
MATRETLHLRSIPYDDERFSDVIMFICYLFGIQDMHEDQKLAIKAFIEGKDIYFSASTGYGKSMVFQSLPFVVDTLRL